MATNLNLNPSRALGSGCVDFDVLLEMIGKLTSLNEGPRRNVQVTVTPDSLTCELAKPRREIPSSAVTGITIEASRYRFRRLIHLWLQTDAGDVDFYRSRSMFDIALLLDELEAVIGPKPRTLKNIEEAEQAGDGDA